MSLGPNYVHLWADSLGETHLARGQLRGLRPVPFSTGTLQHTRTEGLPEPSRVVVSVLDPSSENPWHTAPKPQLVVALSGAWYVQASDGDLERLEAGGRFLWQDNTADSPAPKAPLHYSGCYEDQPCTHLIVQCDSWEPQVDSPLPFS